MTAVTVGPRHVGRKGMRRSTAFLTIGNAFVYGFLVTAIADWLLR